MMLNLVVLSCTQHFYARIKHLFQETDVMLATKEHAIIDQQHPRTLFSKPTRVKVLKARLITTKVTTVIILLNIAIDNVFILIRTFYL
ncbi:hypothetical protein RR51_25750 [Pseudomonas sp. C5pp]|nr:hypothetical protein RR51_25750 [Pseudomonas sp. C5pp]